MKQRIIAAMRAAKVSCYLNDAGGLVIFFRPYQKDIVDNILLNANPKLAADKQAA